MGIVLTKNESTSLIAACFDEFYKQVLKYRQLVSSKPWENKADQETSSPHATAQYILSRLQIFLGEQEETVISGETGFVATYYAEAQFIMVSLADEVFLTLEWPGKGYWESNLLEQRFYDTHSAGQIFFDKLDLLLRNKDPAQIDLAILYLNALALGFQGKYRHFDQSEVLESYRQKLFIFINRRKPYLFRKKIQLFPDAYAYTLEGGVSKDLPTLRNWYLVVLSLGFAYLLASYIIWHRGTSDISHTVHRIISPNKIKE